MSLLPLFFWKLFHVLWCIIPQGDVCGKKIHLQDESPPLESIWKYITHQIRLCCSERNDICSFPQKPTDPGYRHSSGEVTPNYKLVESGAVDMARAWNDGALKISSYPEVCHYMQLFPCDAAFSSFSCLQWCLSIKQIDKMLCILL